MPKWIDVLCDVSGAKRRLYECGFCSPVGVVHAVFKLDWGSNLFEGVQVDCLAVTRYQMTNLIDGVFTVQAGVLQWGIAFGFMQASI